MTTNWLDFLQELKHFIDLKQDNDAVKLPNRDKYAEKQRKRKLRKYTEVSINGISLT